LNILLICGGGGTEHNVSISSADYLEKIVKKVKDVNLIRVTITNEAWLLNDLDNCELSFNHFLMLESGWKQKIDYVIPCIHGHPGESGQLLSYLELIKIPFMGCNSESSRIFFNKASTKLWLEHLSIPTTPFKVVSNDSGAITIAEQCLEIWGEVFIKPINQGSSIGCHRVPTKENLIKSLKDSFRYSDKILIEKYVKARELEVAIYKHRGKLVISGIGEVSSSEDEFYTYEEKYSKNSVNNALTNPNNLSSDINKQINEICRKIIKNIKISDLSRIDFFYTCDREIYVNEINTFPGMTESSLFPRLLLEDGCSMYDFIIENVEHKLNKGVA